jgi:starch synthase
MCSLRYGTPPIVHATGGLADTVVNYDPSTGQGTGFVIYQLNARSLSDTVGWALSTYFDRARRSGTMRQRGTKLDFSRTRAAAYEELYRDAYRRRNGGEAGRA